MHKKPPLLSMIVLFLLVDSSMIRVKVSNTVLFLFFSILGTLASCILNNSKTFRHILECLAFSEFVLPKTTTLRRTNHIVKIQWEIHFFTRHIVRRNAPQKNLNGNCKGLD